MEYKIKQNFVTLARRNDRLLTELAEHNGVRNRTIYKWLGEQHKVMRAADNLEIIARHFNIKQTKRLLEEVESELS